MSTADQPQPTASGDLAKTPFAHLVLYLHRESLSGTLVIDRGGFETKILFRNGRGVAARPLPRGTALQDGLLELCAVEAAPYTFWDSDLLGDASGVIQGTVDPLTFVTESLRGHVRDAVVSSVVDRYRGIALRLVPDADFKRLGIRGAEARSAERLREHAATPEEFCARAELNSDDARRLLYLLLITRHAAPPGGEASSGSGVRAAVDADFSARISSAPPSGSAPPSRAPSSQPSAHPSAKVSSHPPPSGASSQRPTGSQPAAANPTPRPFAPPSVRSPAQSSTRSGTIAATLPPQPGGPSRPAVIGQASMPAWQQLASMRAGTPCSQPVTAPVVVPSLAPPPLEALDNDGKLRRAEKLAERRSFDDAMRIVDDLIARDATRADYHAVRAWILYQQFIGNQPSRPLIETIERALRLNEELPRALYLKGLVLKRMGKDNEAIRSFQRTLDADPRHIEAQRELRLAKMRRDR